MNVSNVSNLTYDVQNVYMTIKVGKISYHGNWEK